MLLARNAYLDYPHFGQAKLFSFRLFSIALPLQSVQGNKQNVYCPEHQAINIFNT